MTTALNNNADRLDSFGNRLRRRLEPGKGERPGRPSDPTWTIQRKLSMNEETLALLEQAADAVSTNERRVSPMQIAALLIEDATAGTCEAVEWTLNGFRNTMATAQQIKSLVKSYSDGRRRNVRLRRAADCCA